MSIPLSINGAVFEYPENFDEAWGVNATGWAQAVTNGMLQRQGGNFPLTADANFGPNFGLVSLYFDSRSANISTAGTLRLASADPGVGFRNNANSGNLILTTDSSDNLLYNGHVISPSSAGTVTSITGTANQVIASSSTGNITLSLPQSIASTSSPRFQNEVINGVLFLQDGTTNTIGLEAPSVVTSYSLTLPPNAGSSGQVLRTDGSGTTTWVNAAGGGTINSGTQYQLAYYAANGATLSGNTNIVTDTNNQLIVKTGLPMFLSGQSALTVIQANRDPSTGVFSDASKSTASMEFVCPAGASSVEFFTASAANTGPTLNTTLTSAGNTFAVPLAMSTNKITGLANGTVSTDAAAFGQIVGSFVAPTVQRLTLLSGTYTTPTSPRSPLYLRVKMVGGAGGGSGGGSGAGDGSNGVGSTFGASLGAGGGVGGPYLNSSGGGAGGSNLSGGGTVILNILGGAGEGAQQDRSGVSLNCLGGIGGATPWGGGARQVGATGTSGGPAAGASGQNGTGEGGQGGFCRGTSNAGGSGGGAGGYLEVFITTPLSTYAYTVGSGGNGGAGGSSGAAGGAGASGLIVVEEYYQ